jgi:hypothetical protein
VLLVVSTFIDTTLFNDIETENDLNHEHHHE